MLGNSNRQRKTRARCRTLNSTAPRRGSRGSSRPDHQTFPLRQRWAPANTESARLNIPRVLRPCSNPRHPRTAAPGQTEPRRQQPQARSRQVPLQCPSHDAAWADQISLSARAAPASRVQQEMKSSVLPTRAIGPRLLPQSSLTTRTELKTVYTQRRAGARPPRGCRAVAPRWAAPVAGLISQMSVPPALSKTKVEGTTAAAAPRTHALRTAAVPRASCALRRALAARLGAEAIGVVSAGLPHPTDLALAVRLLLIARVGGVGLLVLAGALGARGLPGQRTAGLAGAARRIRLREGLHADKRRPSATARKAT